MTPMQQMLLGVGAKKKTYVDDLFNTDLWTGDGASHQVVNNINLSGDGGMVWMKSRSHANNHMVADTVRGSNKVIFPDVNAVEQTSTGYFTSFNSNGFTTGDSSYVYESGKKMAGWSFKKTEGFFDVVTYTGNGSNRTISHSLGSIPGLIIIKNLDSTESWRVYHRDLGATHRLLLNLDFVSDPESGAFNNTAPTASVFTVGTDNAVNQNGDDFVAYLFAGGESTAATARSVDFDGSGDYLKIGGGTDMQLGTGDFTIETFAYFDTNNNGVIYEGRPDAVQGAYISIYTENWGNHSGDLVFYTDSANRITASGAIHTNAWYHVAVVRQSSVTKLYINGIEQGSYSDSSDYTVRTDGPVLGISRNLSNAPLDGKLSNFRIVKGTAVYASSFRPPTEPLTSITNTKLLCCNDSSITGATVTPNTITSGGDPTASTDSPFDDPAAFTFGDAGDQNVIKCGSYVGSGSSGLEINLGWEPQWVMLKDTTSASKNWMMLDCMRGIVTNEDDNILMANHLDDEDTAGRMSLTPTGFKLNTSNTHFNADGDTYIYLAIRRSDGYVGKPADAGTDVFTMDTGNSNADQAFTSGFPVDYAFYKEPASTAAWYSHSRLTGKKYMYIDVGNQTEQTNSWAAWDDNTGWAENTHYNSDFQSWMWKRHAGFDVVTTLGGSGKLVPHNLGGVPEMIWLKARDSAQDWKCYHFGVNGGSNPEQYGLIIDSSGAQNQSDGFWNNVAPTATHFSTGTWTSGGGSSSVNYMMMLFRSISGISKCGYYTGTGSSGHTITTGFQPRFVFFKRTDSSESWKVFDSLRTTGSPFSKQAYFDVEDAQDTNTFFTVSSTGFTLNSTNVNGSNEKYIYYAHA